MTKPLILIPVYQPEDRVLSDLVRELDRLDSAGIVLVNDGSDPVHDDLFRRLADRHGLTLLVHEANRGKGAALKTGFRHVRQNRIPCSHVVTVDADGQHLPADVGRVMETAMASPGELVMGVRGFKGNVPLRSWIGNKATYLLFRGLVGRKITDTQTGLRAIPSDLLDRLAALTSDRYAFELDMLLSLIQDGVGIRETVIRTVYEDNNSRSSFRPVTDSALIYRTLFGWWLTHRFMEMIRYSLSSMLSTIADFGVYIILINLSFGIASASVLARAVSLIVHFSSNKYFTFSARNRPDLGEIGKYLMVAAFNLSASIGLIYLFVTYLAMGEVIAKVVAQTSLFIFTYALLNGFVFLRKQGNRKPEAGDRRPGRIS